MKERVVFSSHALKRIALRNIQSDWVLAILESPLRSGPDPDDQARTRAYGRVPQFGNRMLRVVYEVIDGSLMVVTATWDRNAGRRM